MVAFTNKWITGSSKCYVIDGRKKCKATLLWVTQQGGVTRLSCDTAVGQKMSRNTISCHQIRNAFLCHATWRRDISLLCNIVVGRKMSHNSTSCHTTERHHVRSSDRDAARSWDSSRKCMLSLCASVSCTQGTRKTWVRLCCLSSL